MHRLLRLLLGSAALLFVALACTLLPATRAGAAPKPTATAPGIGIRLLEAPTNRRDDPRARIYIVDHLAPATVIHRAIEVSNSTAAPVSVQLYAAAASVDGDRFDFADGRTGNELSSWISVSPSAVTAPPGGSVRAVVTVAVPDGASAGERYAVVWAEPPGTPTDAHITLVNRVGIRVYLSVGQGPEPATEFTISSLRATRDGDGIPVLAATVQNTGQRALDVSGEASLDHGPAGVSTSAHPAQLGTTIAIGGTGTVRVPFDRDLPDGPWDAHLTLRSGTTSRTASEHVEFGSVPAATADAPTLSFSPARPGETITAAALLAAAALLIVGTATAVVAHQRRRTPTDASMGAAPYG